MNIEFAFLDMLQGIRTPILDYIMCFITHWGDAGAVWIVMALVLLIIPRTRKCGIVLAVSLCIDAILCNGMLKNIAARMRPCDVNTYVQLLIARPADYSFPSGHTATSFAAVSALYFGGGKRLWKISLVPACLIAFSRMYLYVHYPTDVLGGIVVGIVSGYLGYVILKRLDRMRNRKNDRAMEG